jgi:hypothetical protein
MTRRGITSRAEHDLAKPARSKNRRTGEPQKPAPFLASLPLRRLNPGVAADADSTVAIESETGQRAEVRGRLPHCRCSGAHRRLLLPIRQRRKGWRAGVDRRARVRSHAGASSRPDETSASIWRSTPDCHDRIKRWPAGSRSRVMESRRARVPIVERRGRMSPPPVPPFAEERVRGWLRFEPCFYGLAQDSGPSLPQTRKARD